MTVLGGKIVHTVVYPTRREALEAAGLRDQASKPTE